MFVWRRHAADWVLNEAVVETGAQIQTQNQVANKGIRYRLVIVTPTVAATCIFRVPEIPAYVSEIQNAGIYCELGTAAAVNTGRSALAATPPATVFTCMPNVGFVPIFLFTCIWQSPINSQLLP